MNIRNKTIVVSVTALAAIFVIFRFLFAQVMAREFQKAEDLQLRRNAARLEALVESSIETLSEKAADWAFWDDSYSFIETKDPRYVRSNLQLSNLETLGISQVAYWNKDRQPVQRSWRENGGGSQEDLKNVAEQLNRIVKEAPPNIDATFSSRGVLITARRAYLFVMLPILTSERHGPARGFLSFVAEFDWALVGTYSQLLDLPVRWVRYDEASSEQQFAKAMGSLERSTTAIRKLTALEAQSYYRVDTVDGVPAVVLAAESSRAVPRQLAGALRLLDQLLVALAVFCGICLFWMVEHVLLRDLRAMQLSLQEIAEQADYSRRFAEGGKKDPLKQIGRGINLLLQALQNHQPVVVEAVAEPMVDLVEVSSSESEAREVEIAVDSQSSGDSEVVGETSIILGETLATDEEAIVVPTGPTIDLSFGVYSLLPESSSPDDEAENLI